MFFLTLFLLLGGFVPALADESEEGVNHHYENSTALELICTTSSVSGNFSGCLEDEITEYKAVFIANAAGVISIGAPANLVTLLALPYVRLRYPDKVPELNTNTAILILHLSLTDFLYCLLGLPFIIATLHHGYFPASASLCSFSALVRNLISYADFLTMAAIALISSMGLISDRNFYRRFARTPVTLAICAGIWMLAFAIISPIIFGFELFGHNFGKFGWDPGAGRCNVRHIIKDVEPGSKPREVIFVFGVITPFLVIFVSYIVLGLCFRRLHGKSGGLTCMHVTMLRLSFAYAIFTAPLLPAHLFDNTSTNRLRMTPFRSMILFSWYCWMYAINVIIYVVSSREFRKVYGMFFADVFAGFATIWRRSCFLKTSDSSIELPRIQ